MIAIAKENLKEVFSNWSSVYCGHRTVIMPPRYKKDELPIEYTFVFTHRELSVEEYISFFVHCAENEIMNARLFSPRTLQLASCFHPTFFHSIKQVQTNDNEALSLMFKSVKEIKINSPVSPELDLGSVKHWLQSLIFLSGVTLSAAIIQDRWSVGTLESKLSRLWQVGQYENMKGLEALKKLDIPAFVSDNADLTLSNPAELLKKLKKFYSEALFHLSEGIPAVEKEIHVTELNDDQKKRFGFVDELKRLVGDNLNCILLYGSAVNSVKFSDYDLIVVVKDLPKALSVLEGASPMYNNIELNISLFDERDFTSYQLVSGDNLIDHAICLYGSAKVPHKTKADLIARNFSFGYIRFRQLMGMASPSENLNVDFEEKRNLLNYFIKIPLNVYKGLEGCFGAVGTNEEIIGWAKENVGFDINSLQEKLRSENKTEAIASSTWATQEVMFHFSKKYNLF